ncbi:MAG: hypothetical protein AAGG46_10050, partial [Planctomycetota bacterium]
MKSSDLLDKLPSVNELLEHPQLKSVADRLNRSVAASRVRGFLDQLAEEVRSRASETETSVAASVAESMRELVSRASRYLTGGDPSHVGVTI